MATLSSLSTSAGGALRLLDRRIYTANGTWTKPADNAGNILAGVGKIVRVRVIGGGGGGLRNFYAYYSNQTWQCGGCGGGMSEMDFDISQLAASVSTTVGVGGTGSTGIEVPNANKGGTSSFGTYLYAEGGEGGKSAVSSSIAYDQGVHISLLAASGGAGTTKGSRGVQGFVFYQSSSYVIYYHPPERGAGPGGGGNSTHGPSPSGTCAVGFDSTIEGPGAGGLFTAGRLYGGGGGASGSTGYSGAQGIVVVETWG
jgi:hypothetical protein